MSDDNVDLDMLRCSLCYKYPNKRKCFSCAVADEIERLRVEVAAWRDLDKERIRTIRQGNDFMLSQDAEIERLRAAGDALAATWPEEDRCNCNNADCRAVVAAFDAWQEARRG